jgi:hypothetical protein
VKLAVVAPDATRTALGTVKAALLLERATLAPLPVAAAEIVTVQEELAPESTLVGVHCNPVTVGSGGNTVIDPSVPVTQMAFPLASTPTRPLRESGTEDPLSAPPRVTPITATTPLPISVAFMPVARQVSDVALAAQDRDLPALVSALPGAAEIAARLPEGYEMVHCRPAGELPVTVESVRFRNRELP